MNKSPYHLSQSDVNHLRRLLGYMRCEVGQDPEEMRDMVHDLLPFVEPVSDEGKARLIESYQKSANVPKYVRAAIKALEKVVRQSESSDTDGAYLLTTKTPLSITNRSIP